MRARTLPFLAFSALLAAAPAWSQTTAPTPALRAPGQQPSGTQPAPSSPAEGADQVVGLFLQTCVRFAGNSTALRDWLKQQGAPEMPAEAQPVFLGNRKGQAYDASYQSTRLALVSGDDNSCSAIAEIADPAQTVQNLQEAMKQSNITLASQGEHADKQDPALMHHDYQATVAGRRWLILVTTTSQPGQGRPFEAVLTLRPA